MAGERIPFLGAMPGSGGLTGVSSRGLEAIPPELGGLGLKFCPWGPDDETPSTRPPLSMISTKPLVPVSSWL